MAKSLHSNIAGMLPGLGGRIPTQDLGERVIPIITAGHIDMISNPCRFQSISWCWKVAGPHLPPLKVSVTSSVDGHLVVDVRVSVFIYSSASLAL